MDESMAQLKDNNLITYDFNNNIIGIFVLCTFFKTPKNIPNFAYQ